MDELQILITGLYDINRAIKSLQKLKEQELRLNSKAPVIVKDEDGSEKAFPVRNNAVVDNYNRGIDILRAIREEKEVIAKYIIDVINDERTFLQNLREAKEKPQRSDNAAEKSDYQLMREAYSLCKSLYDNEKMIFFEAYHNYLYEKNSHLKKPEKSK